MVSFFTDLLFDQTWSKDDQSFQDAWSTNPHGSLDLHLSYSLLRRNFDLSVLGASFTSCAILLITFWWYRGYPYRTKHIRTRLDAPAL